MKAYFSGISGRPLRLAAKICNITNCAICSPPGKNIVHQITVTLEELYNGATRKLAVQKNTICDRCEGTFLLKKKVA